MLLNAWLLAAGTLTAIPTPAPRAVDRRTAGLAMILAPLAVLPLGLVVGAIALAGLPQLLKGILAVGVLALGTRAFHLDGLADTVDGLAASHDRERSLAIMKTGDIGPAGAAALILVLGLQAVGFAYVLDGWRGAVVAVVAVIGSRVALATCCARGVPSARPGGLGDTYTQTVSLPVTTALWAVLAAGLTAAAHGFGLAWWRGPIAVAVAGATVGLLIVHVRRRLGGVTGDVFGASIELALAALLVVLA
jgi:adenosylcobinamide-GDP ribazoletransferase